MRERVEITVILVFLVSSSLFGCTGDQELLVHRERGSLTGSVVYVSSNSSWQGESHADVALEDFKELAVENLQIIGASLETRGYRYDIRDRSLKGRFCDLILITTSGPSVVECGWVATSQSDHISYSGYVAAADSPDLSKESIRRLTTDIASQLEAMKNQDLLFYNELGRFINISPAEARDLHKRHGLAPRTQTDKR